ncbi:glycerophosphodiester phosphodiesterase family protein [Cryobacterium sp. PH31-AA6]|uniref:glycerophosphodiester phosphodiesterase family protein n=1 Tax=Cryobacterium sp. PH31-AA6 TaxID=3046205 RepID=UPI0024BB8CB7|nr:glycerophosphodiester phosphodiesterase family protein [Cryobacterium sp. PH31-AA6]MDJ0322617.1 glycerophosphodiester phosphodiesterase family protein [Cryobacterium sp. PH31-AA6]
MSGGESRFLDGPGPRVFAHRGLSLNAAENTILAFEHALLAGATHLETDVRASDDGIAVLSHDADFAVPGARIRVDRLRMAELRRINLGHGQPFAGLGEALDTFPDARFNLDVKSDAAVDATVEAVRAANATDRVLITSFSDERRARTVGQLPGVATSASASIVVRAFLAAELRLSGQVRRAMSGISAMQIPETMRSLRVLTPRFVRAMHAIGVEVHVWTVNDPAAMRRMLDAGVDGLVTDRCDLAVGVIAARS